METLFFWIALSIAVGLFAPRKGRDAGRWIFLSLLISPLLGALFLMIATDLSPDAEEKRHAHLTHTRCPECRELIRKDARKCKHCGSMINTEQA